MSNDYEVTLPKLGESIMNATIVQWFKKEGDTVKRDEPLLEVATDKVNSEIPSPVSGVLKKIHAEPEQDLDVGELLAVIAQTDQAPAEEPKARQEKKPAAAPSGDMQDYYSPAILRLAREHNIPLSGLEKIPGSGTGGRLTKKDLEDYVAKRGEGCPLAAPMPLNEEIEHVKMEGMRKVIAENMVRSFYEAPHASLIREVDVTDLFDAIEKNKQDFLKKHGVKISVTSFIARAIARGLQEYPWLNSSLKDDTIMIKRFVNLGVAVSVEQGVMVPVIRGVQKLPLHEIAQSIADYAKRARTNTLKPDDVKEGTITMTNFGMTGVQIGIPIIRYPEVAIIGIGSVNKRVMPLSDDSIGVRKMMYISLTFDHRIIDGLYGCGFLGAVQRHLEQDVAFD